MLYEPRPLQAEIHAALKRFNVLVCHRRFGKTTLSINQLIGSALRVVRDPASARPHFAYVAPLRNQVKNIAWDLLKHYAAPFVEAGTVNEAELRLDLVTGARIQLFGADNVDAARGLGFNGVVLDEYADMDPTMWTQVISPALADRRGWVIFIGTPRGENHFREIYETARLDTSGQWFHRLLKASETGVLSVEELENQRGTKSDEEYAQEFECSFTAPVSGAYYGKEIEATRSAKRVGKVPHEPGLSVHTAWDLGMDDATAIWFVQLVGREIHLIDYIENSGVGLDHYVNELRARRYVYGTHILPHDASVRELGTGRSRVETLQSLGVGQVAILAQQTVADGINAARQVLPRCWFDEEKCRAGVRALTAYRSEYDPKRKVFSPRPVHDWACTVAGTVIAGAGPVESIRVGDSVDTPVGKRRVTAVYRYDDAPLVSLTLGDGRNVVCTPNHEWFTMRGLIRTDALRYDDVLFSGQEVAWRVLSSIFRAVATIKSTLQGTLRLCRRANSGARAFVGACSIAIFGRLSAVLSPMGMRSTTSTGSGGTIGSTISSVCRALHTRSFTARRVGGGVLRGTGPTGVELGTPRQVEPPGSVTGSGTSPRLRLDWSRHARLLEPGTGLPTGLHGIVSMAGVCGKGESLSRKFASFAVRATLRLFRPVANTAGSIVAKQPCGRGAVYGLTVEGEHCYVANGILSSNSHAADAFRYLALGLPRLGDRSPLAMKQAVLPLKYPSLGFV